MPQIDNCYEENNLVSDKIKQDMAIFLLTPPFYNIDNVLTSI